MSSRPATAISVAPIVATSFSRPLGRSHRRGLHHRDGAAGLDHQAFHAEALALGRRQQVDLEFDGQHAASAASAWKAGVAAGRVERGGHHAGMQEAVLLRQRLLPGQLDHDPAGFDLASVAPMVAMAACGEAGAHALGEGGSAVRSAVRPWAPD
jgi:hypothetical protein